MKAGIELMKAGGANIVGTYAVLRVPGLQKVFEEKIGDVPWACFL